MASDWVSDKDQIACKVLTDLLLTDWADLRRGLPEFWPHEISLLRQLMLADLTQHASLVGANERAKIWAHLGPKLSPSIFAEVPHQGDAAVSPKKGPALLSPTRLLPSSRRGDEIDMNKVISTHPADIVILTILPVERDAVLAAFDQDPRRKEEFSDKGNFYYRIPFRSHRYDVNMTAWLAMIGAPRNVRCAIFVGRLSRFFRFSNIALLGIAGGNRTRVRLGDVVTSTEVLDNEGGVDELRPGWIRVLGQFFGIKRHQPRIQLYSHEGISTNLLRNFTVDKPEWHRIIGSIVAAGNRGALNFDPTDADVHAEHKPGLIQAGDKLKKDGSLPQTAKTFHDKLYAVEMEGSGFAQACKSDDYEWLVFRGISDFGDPEKRDKKQAFAAVAAATLLRQFLESTFQTNATRTEEF